MRAANRQAACRRSHRGIRYPAGGQRAGSKSANHRTVAARIGAGDNTLMLNAITILGGTLIRQLPPDTLLGLATGQYTLHGGVIRYAAGSDRGGQIVRHLLMPSDASGLGSLAHNLAPTLAQVVPALRDRATATARLLTTMNRTMALSELSLAVNSVGFGVLYAKLGQMDARLKAIAVDVRAVRDLLEQREHAELKSALDTVRKAAAIVDRDVRREMILAASQILSVKRTMFADQLAAADSPELAAAAEAYFTIAALGSARCFAEVGSLDLAAADLAQAAAHRVEHVRRISTRMIEDRRARLLFADFAEAMPAPLLCETLDFVYDEARGVDWLDALRADLGPFYPDAEAEASKGALAMLRGTASDAGRRITAASRALVASDTDGTARAHDLQFTVPTLLRFSSASRVIDGYVDQYRLMAEHHVLPSTVEQQLAAVPDDQRTEGYAILSFEPTAEAA